MITIPLTRGYTAVVDNRDAHLLRFKWHVQLDGRTAYAYRSVPMPGGTKGSQGLHNAVLGIKHIDHKDGDGLNCRRSNLRSATVAQNQYNQRLSAANTSGFKGVYRVNGKWWRAQIKAGGKMKYVGQFASKIEAARAYDRAARQYWGSFAALNFPHPGERAA
jgi:hypothetical protein